MNKAVIPVAGLGTRMLPATKAIPKEMLPLVDKPLIQFVVNECIISGINNIILVTHSSKNSIENHFDTNFELETVLEKHAKFKLLAEIKSICPCNVTIINIRQGFPKGLGHAILCSYPLVGDCPVAIILPDVIINESCCDLYTDNLADMLQRFSDTGYSQILVKPVQDVIHYGIVHCQNKILQPGDHAKIIGIVEKPISIDSAPSNLAVVGRYVFSAEIWNTLKMLPMQDREEIQLTHAISMLINREIVEAYHLKGFSYDCGSKLGYMQAFVDYGLHHKTWGYDFRVWLKELLCN
ncbi:UTP--glucose-1-phosphate uridylyltransferase [Blochmannia endosymbiont of Camponotus (Colobopsis) obliquus]|nr:UTP--glucose-1-phosphate uridylyltransferase [Blochmannia endosymbiont of Camponotus (Colobopsis) obliquus]